jgi:hypothetical protein
MRGTERCKMFKRKNVTEWDGPEENEARDPDEALVFIKDPDIRWRIAELIAQAARSVKK